MIHVEHLTKRYGKYLAVNDISFDVAPGEIFGFLGANGAGKTTTIRMLTGVLKPTEGLIRIAGHDMATESRSAKLVTGYIPDRPYLYNALTAEEFLRFVADLKELPEDEIPDRIEQLLKSYSLFDRKNDLVGGFSHGMKQRLAVCAALLHRPKVLIVDEPMVGLDPHGAKLLKNLFKQYASEGMAILLSTHSLNVAEELCDRLAIMQKGSLVAVGTLAEFRSLSHIRHERLEEIFLELTWEAGGEQLT